VVPELVERRASDTSTLSSGSARETVGDSTAAPTTYAGDLEVVPPGHADSDGAWRQHPGRTVQPTGDWDSQPMMPDSIIGWIDLDSLFPPPDITCAESFVDFNTPLWTR
jgi:hypothetical protein